MSEPTAALPEVYSASEIALAAGVGAGDVLRWAEAHAVEPLPGGFYTTPQAVRMVRHLVATVEVDAAPRALFERANGPRRKRGWPLALTTAVHMGLVAGLALATTAARPSAHRVEAPMTTQLVFLTTPGPGGGGGGGGRKAATPATAAQRKGVSRLRSPIPAPAPEQAAPSPVDHPPPQPKPEVIAPVASVAPARE